MLRDSVCNPHPANKKRKVLLDYDPLAFIYTDLAPLEVTLATMNTYDYSPNDAGPNTNKGNSKGYSVKSRRVPDKTATHNLYR